MDGGGLTGLLRQPTDRPEDAPTAPKSGSQISDLVQSQGAPTKANPQPSLEQTMAALHHFDAMIKQFQPVMNDPDIGKKSIRPKMLDVLASLMGSRVIKLPTAMSVIKDFPTDPREQKSWVQRLLKQNMMARENVIGHFRAQGPMQQQPQQEGQSPAMPGHQWSADSHEEHMKGLMGHYGRG